ncbi:MAG TPA: hypothetical protein VHB20_08130 [Verrucomicrobiae bacterium]|jgi:hypothetical protein|nr:hypothetical protein [Verrucomicrobiae bacterium]
MKLKWNTVRIVLAATLGSIFWAGCASTQPGPRMVENTTDLRAAGPDTHPEWRTGAYNYNWEDYNVQTIE